jgi:hypothetical protein
MTTEKYQQNITEKLVTKERCDFRWNIIEKFIEDNNLYSNKINNLEKDIEIIKENEKDFKESIQNINNGINKKIENLIIKNAINEEEKKINEQRIKRKQNIRDTIITAVITAFILGTLAGGWELFKKVSIILKNTQSITHSVQPQESKINKIQEIVEKDKK